MAWLVGQTVAAKLIGMAGQLILAWLLIPTDFGLVTLAYTVSTFASLIRDAGLSRILVQRAARGELDRWATPVFWLSLALSLLSALIMVAVAPLAAALYDAPRVVGLIHVLALASPLLGLATVPTAALQTAMRFRFIAATGVATAALTAGLSVVLAWWGWGPYSLIVPFTVAAGARLAMLWAGGRVRVRLNPDFGAWPALAGDSLYLLASMFFIALITQGDYMVLGLFHPEGVVGTYFFAFNLSTQSVTLLMQNLTTVLLPSLSRLNDDPVRQATGFARACRLLMFTAAPLCALQAVLAGPVLHLLYGDKWAAAVPVLQLLSLAMAVGMLSGPSFTLLQARGRFCGAMGYWAMSAVTFLAAVTVGAAWGGAVGTAWGVVAAYLIIGPVGATFAARPGQIGWRWLGPAFALPLALGGGCAALGFGAARALAGAGPVAQGLAAAATALVAYALAARIVARDVVAEAVAYARGMLTRRGTTGIPTASPETGA